MADKLLCVEALTLCIMGITGSANLTEASILANFSAALLIKEQCEGTETDNNIALAPCLLLIELPDRQPFSHRQ